MKVKQMTNNNGDAVKNQFIMTEEGRGALGNFTRRLTFQSYDSVIAIKTFWPDGTLKVEIDINKWDYSKTTGKYRNLFLGEDKATTQKKINLGVYELVDLNRDGAA